MQVLIWSARPSAALRTNAGSARNGRAIETIAASPLARISSASSGVLIRFDATTGIATARCTRAGAKRNAARGTT